MISRRISFVIFVAFLFTGFTAAEIEEDLEVKVSNSNYHPSEAEIQRRLKDADLESHGYKKKVTTSTVNGPNSNKHYKTYWYYKVVNCSEIIQTEQELNTLMPGILGDEVATKLKKEVKSRRLDNMGQCEVGLEVVFKQSRSGNKNASLQSQKRGWTGDVEVKYKSKNVQVEGKVSKDKYGTYTGSGSITDKNGNTAKGKFTYNNRRSSSRGSSSRGRSSRGRSSRGRSSRGSSSRGRSSRGRSSTRRSWG